MDVRHADQARVAKARLRKRARYRRNKRQRLGAERIVFSSGSEFSESADDSSSADDMVNDEHVAEERENEQGQVHDEGEQRGEEEQNEQREVHEEEQQIAEHHNQANGFDMSDSDQGEGSNAENEDEAEENQSDDEHEGSEQSDNGEEASDEENQVHDLDGDQLIYPGAPITLHQSLLAIFTLMSVENLSGKLVESILQLIALHCPEGSVVKKTLYAFKAYFAKIGESVIVFHYFCSNCIYPVESKNSVCPKCQKTDTSFFLELPLLQQLQNLFNIPGFFLDLQFRFREDRKRAPDSIDDIYDGEIYTEQMRNGFLSNGSNISFMWYSDGISIFESSSFSIWPLCLVINELPYKVRTLPQNILLVGLWFGKSKPNPNVFLRPLYRTMNNFETNGLNLKLPDGSEINVKGKVLLGTCDLPAKCKFMQFKQFNSYFGCPKCLIEGGRANTGKSTVQVYPYTANIQKRTHQQSIEFAAQALEARRNDRKASVCGVKGPTLLSKIVPDLIRCTGIDAMHGNFLGNCRTLMSLWFCSTFSTMPWSVHHLFDVVDEKMRKMKSPSFTQRAPRSLKEIKFWKASEFKLFMLYYSVPVLKNVLDDVYFKHHCLLVSGLSLLSQDSISLGQVEAASAMLTSYVSDFARLYPIRYLGLNFHQLIHLSDCVLELGPLWVYSCFFLENFNGKINKFFHGTQHVALQVCSAVAMFMKMPLLRSNLPPDSNVMKFILEIDNKSKAVKIADQIDHCTFAVGTYSFNLLRESANVLRRSLNLVGGSCSVFYRLKRKGVIYFAAEYGRISKVKESSYIMFLDEDIRKFGRILRFVRWSQCRNLCDVGCRNCLASFYAIVRVFQRKLWFLHEMRDVRLPYMSGVQATEEIEAIQVQSIVGLCFFIESNNEQYLATAVNRLEVE